MKLAQNSADKFEAFFREHYRNERFKMPGVNIYAGKLSRHLTEILKIHGITIGGNIFVSPLMVNITADNLTKLHLELAAHEITHVLQFRREGFLIFFYKYFRDYWRNLSSKENWSAISRQQAYMEIPFEIEARRVAASFVEWNGEQSKKVK